MTGTGFLFVMACGSSQQAPLSSTAEALAPTPAATTRIVYYVPPADPRADGRVYQRTVDLLQLTLAGPDLLLAQSTRVVAARGSLSGGDVVMLHNGSGEVQSARLDVAGTLASRGKGYGNAPVAVVTATAQSSRAQATPSRSATSAVGCQPVSTPAASCSDGPDPRRRKTDEEDRPI